MRLTVAAFAVALFVLPLQAQQSDSVPNAAPKSNLVLGSVMGVPRAGEGASRETFLGTWSLTDEQNELFNVTLFEDGTARTNWTKGPNGAVGESGRWSIYGLGVRVDYDDGWIDIIRYGPNGFEQVSYSPTTPVDGPWTNGGKAVRPAEDLAPFVGVFSLIDNEGEPFAVALQSNGLCFKSIDREHRGLWSVGDGCAEIRWLDGWTDQLHRLEEDRWEQRTWAPGADPGSKPRTETRVSRIRAAGLDGAAPDTSRSRFGILPDPQKFAGVWALTDGQNNTFDVVLFPGGAARSTWSKGPEGSCGEWGRWRPYGEGVRVDYDNGWIDLIRYSPSGFEEVAFSPETPVTARPSAIGKAVRTTGDHAGFIGVFELRMEQNGEPFCVAIQSDGLAFKNIPGEPTDGTWTLEGDAAVIRWSDGWIDAFTLLENGRVEQKTWIPGSSFKEPPAGTQTGRRLRDGLPGPLRPAAPPPRRE